MIDFNDSTLYISLRSPFARRVRLAFLEHDVHFVEKTFDVFKPTNELLVANPLGRIPVLELRSGNLVIDSGQILNLFYGESSKSPLVPWSEEDRLIAAKWAGVGVGLCEKVVEQFLESVRPQGVQWQELLDENLGLIKAAVRQFDGFIRGRETICGQGLTQADLDMGCGLGYLTLRIPWDWKRELQDAAAYFERLSARSSRIDSN